MRLAIFLLAIQAFAQPQIAWTPKTVSTAPGQPSFVGWNDIYWDPVSHSVLVPAARRNISTGATSNTIYATSYFWYKPTGTCSGGIPAPCFEWIAGYDRAVNRCTKDAPNMPGDRHPVGQMAIDTTRNRWWLTGGINTACDGAGIANRTGTSVVHTGGEIGYRFDPSWVGEQVIIGASTYTVASVDSDVTMTLTSGVGSDTGIYVLLEPSIRPVNHSYYMSLNSNPALNTWTKVGDTTPFHLNEGSMVYVPPPIDVLLVWGNGGYSGRMLVFCPGSSLTANQISAGCVANNVWRNISSLVTGDGPGGPQVGWRYSKAMWDPATGRVITFFGQSGSDVASREVYAYNVLAKSMSVKCNPCAPPVNGAGVGVTQYPAVTTDGEGKFFYHYSGPNPPEDWLYESVPNTWTKLTTTGSGPATQVAMTYDDDRDVLVVWGAGGSNSVQLWEGTVTDGSGGGATSKAIGGSGSVAGSARIQ